MTPIAARTCAAVLTACSLAWFWPASPTTAENTERTVYYQIAGTSTRQLRDALNEKRPVGKDGKPHDAVTSWFVRWRYGTTPSSGGCAVRNFDVSLEISMTLPKWTNESDAVPELVQHWRTYYAALLKHEDGHKAIGSGAATDIREAGS